MRLIDADRLIDEFEDTVGSPIARTRLKLQVQNQPTVDAVKVVRCKDCKNRYRTECSMKYLEEMRLNDTDFCSLGERKTYG